MGSEFFFKKTKQAKNGAEVTTDHCLPDEISDKTT